MERRELLKMIAVLTGATMVGTDVLVSGCKPKDSTTTASKSLTPENAAFLDEVAETILPETKTPGAKAAKVGSFMVVYVNDCYTERDRKIFTEGIDKLNDACKKMHKHGFMEATPAERKELLLSLEPEVKKHQEGREAWNKDQDAKEKEHISRGGEKYQPYERENFAEHYYTMMKQITLWGYFTSKEGITQAQRFDPVPGKWEACIDYKKGDTRFVGLDG